MKRAVVVQIAVTWIWMGLRRSEPSLEILGITCQVRRDWPGSRWILRFPVNGGDRPRGKKRRRKSRLEGVKPLIRGILKD